MTIKDIAKESGYAIGTVSRVLNNNPSVSPAARAKILEVIKRYNYQPNSNAKHLKQQSSDGLALIVKGTQNMLFVDILGKKCRLSWRNADMFPRSIILMKKPTKLRRPN